MKDNGFKGLKLKHSKFLQPIFSLWEKDCFCPKTLKHFRFKYLRRFLKPCSDERQNGFHLFKTK